MEFAVLQKSILYTSAVLAIIIYYFLKTNYHKQLINRQFRLGYNDKLELYGSILAYKVEDKIKLKKLQKSRIVRVKYGFNRKID